MKESSQKIFKSSAQNLARMLDIEETEKSDWMPNDFGAMLRHQLAMPVCFDLDLMRREANKRTRWEEGANPPHTFGDLFRSAGGSVDLLVLSKDFAKASLAHPDSSIPQAIAEVIYYCSIAAALVHYGKSISQLDCNALTLCFQRALNQPWLDESLKPLFQGAISRINASPNQ